jgi:hypothetical protein
MLPSRASGTLRKHLTEALRLIERCEVTPHAGVSGTVTELAGRMVHGCQ